MQACFTSNWVKLCVQQCILLSLILLLPSNCHRHLPYSIRTVFVSQDAPLGLPVIEISSQLTGKFADSDELSVVLDTGTDFAHYFTFHRPSNALVTAKSLSALVNNGPIALDLIISTNAPNPIRKRILPYLIQVIPASNALGFSRALYYGEINETATIGTLVRGLNKISASVPNQPTLQPIYAIKSGNQHGFFDLATEKDETGRRIGKLYTSKSLINCEGEHRLEIAAEIPGQGHNIPTAVVEVTVKDTNVPVFALSEYSARIKQQLPVGSNVLRVTARSKSNARVIWYSMDDSDVPFDVDSLVGDLFVRGNLFPQTYLFHVYAKDFSGNFAKVPIRVEVFEGKANQEEDEEKPLSHEKEVYKTKKRFRRFSNSERPPMKFVVKENYPVNNFLTQSINLGANERVAKAPVVFEYITVFENGSMYLTKPLNYESVFGYPVQLTVTIRNLQTDDLDSQTIEVIVKDVEEKPRFTNQPKPYQAVVSDNTRAGMLIYEFTARDEDGDGDRDVTYSIDCKPPAKDFFSIDQNGKVRTTGTYGNPYQDGDNYECFVQATDLTYNSHTEYGDSRKSSDVAVLDIRVGNRPPQFYQEHYHVYVSEDLQPQQSVVHIQAKSFRDEDIPIHYSLWKSQGFNQIKREPSEVFAIDKHSGVVKLLQPLDYDDVQRPHLHKLQVVANEGGVENKVDVEVEVMDENDNNPVFTQPLYSQSVREDIRPTTPILTVSTRDADSDKNKEVEYSVDDPNFTVNQKGQIFAKNGLDADQNRQGFYIYEFTIKAKDKGEKPRYAESKIHIRTENVNDETPFFIDTNQYAAYVAEDSQGNTPVVTIQAQDPDKDQVRYSFATPQGIQQTALGFFDIDVDTGLIRLRNGISSSELQKSDIYNLTVIAVDDGSCCGPSSPRHTSTATVIVGISDVNNNKPVFRHCETYSNRAKVPEGQFNNKVILRVEATDEDSQRNGEIEYSLYYAKGSARKPFTIDRKTGDLMTSPYVVFDRETIPFEDVTVKATDKGERPLIGFCQFTVQVLDLNDNRPQFDRASYETSVSRSTSIGHSVVTVFADDIDAPENARITYRLKPDPAMGMAHQEDPIYFTIKADSGEITLISPLPAGKEALQFLVEASDNGNDPVGIENVTVLINVRSAMQSYPQWQSEDECPAYKRVDENIQTNTIFFTCYAISGSNPDNPISYSMANGVKLLTNSQQDFREFQTKKNGRDYVVIRNLRVLDYEKTPQYNLTITATDLRSGVSTDKALRVFLNDMNDEIPQFPVDKFIGQVIEEQDPSAHQRDGVVNVTANDRDHASPANLVTYRLLPGAASQFFRIDRKTGVIYPTARFDREQNDSFILDVQAMDGTKSDLPGTDGPNTDITKVQIIVEDVNDNPPFFNRTREHGKVRENAQIGQNVMTVKAHDKDRETSLKYSLLPSANGERIPFGVNANSGTIFVKEALDFEEKESYEMTLQVTDGLFPASTQISIDVIDVNDNAPQFDNKLYEVNMKEEMIPQGPMLKVTATDRDRDATSRSIVYRVEGQGAGDYFMIDPSSGEITVQKPLNRDPPAGADQWNFIVQAIDDGGSGLIGYADVRVILSDINDNAPFFSDIEPGSIEENRDTTHGNIYVMTVTATDYDDPTTGNAQLKYSIRTNKMINGQKVFVIDENTGKIFGTMKLDRENSTQRQFEIEVVATDRGHTQLSGSAKALIKVLDVNDNEPYFSRPVYEAVVDEDKPVHHHVLTVSALDPDNEAEDNVLHYTLEDQHPHAEEKHFYIASEPDTSGSYVGVLRIQKPLDYEDYRQRDGFNLTVGVTDGQYHAHTQIFVKINDKNDNAPEVIGPKEVRFSEAEKVGYAVATFTARDMDFGGKDTHTFRINRTTDQNRKFTISNNGVLKVAKTLDRETKASYRLKIEAEDSAGNVGNNILSIYLEDVNDNAPTLRTAAPAVVWENRPAGQNVATVFGTDPDTRKNGPPFHMELAPQSYFTDQFSSVFNQNGDGGNGTLDLRTKVVFDREKAGKVLQIPIIVSDSGEKIRMTATRYLPVIIGDVNDNPMFDGTKKIHVYDYKGSMPTTEIGTVYVVDADDWDRKDKVFTWKNGKQPNFNLKPYGVLEVEAGISEGEYRLEVLVVDNSKTKREVATGTVIVTVERIEEEAFLNSGSVRLRGITAEDFMTVNEGVSPYTQFRKRLAARLGIPESGVQIFSVMPRGQLPPIVDIRFAAHNSPYIPAVGLNGIVEQDKANFEAAIPNGQIIQVGISECIWESCESGCWTDVVADTKPTLVNTNATAFVGVTTTTSRVCSCPATNVPTACTRTTCQNNGICHPTSTGFFCECRGDFSGGRCELKTRSFQGHGWAWFDPLGSCAQSHISFEFMTSGMNGVLLYNGPMNPSQPMDEYSPDAITVGIKSGKLTMGLDMGAGSPSVLSLQNGPEVSDGKWHTVDIYRKRKEFMLVLDKCRNVAVDKVDGAAIDRTPCQLSGMTSGDFEQLNVQDPLQLGGVAPSGDFAYPSISATLGGNVHFDGCIRNLLVNNKLYDMARPGRQEGSQMGCSQTKSLCESNSLDGPNFCVHGECVAAIGDRKATCICDPGWMGESCNERAEWFQFNDQSFINYFIANPISPAETDMKILFVRGSDNGDLSRASDVAGREYVSATIENRKAQFTYQLGSGVKTMQLQPQLSNNESYWLHIQRVNDWTKISLDKLGGRFSQEQSGEPGDHGLLDYDPHGFYLGAQSSSPNTLVDFKGCVRDFRWDNNQLPLSTTDQSNTYASIAASSGITPGCTLINTCVGLGSVYCRAPFVCVDFWKGPFCTCPPGKAPKLNENGMLASCGELVPGALHLGLSTGAMAAILVCFLTLIILALILVAYSRRRRPGPEPFAPEDDIRENIINYAEEGGGEEDQDTYNIAPLRKPVLPPDIPAYPISNGVPLRAPDPDGVRDFIGARKQEADVDPTAPPFDELRIYGDEGDGMSTAGSLSSLSSAGESDVDWDEQLGSWGPRFQKLADMYAGQDD